MNRTGVNIPGILAKVTFMGLIMNVFVPISIFIAATFLLDKDLQSGGGLNFEGDSTVRILFFALLTISVVDFIVTYALRKKLPRSLFKTQAS